MLEVSDQETLDQKVFHTAYVSIPVQIGPKVPLLRCPDYAVTLNAAGRPRDIDIPTLCHAWLPPGMTLDDVAFETRWEPEPDGVELRQSGAGQRTVTVRAARDAPTSSDGRIRVQARGADEVSYIRGLGHRARQRGRRRLDERRRRQGGRPTAGCGPSPSRA